MGRWRRRPQSTEADSDDLRMRNVGECWRAFVYFRPRFDFDGARTYMQCLAMYANLYSLVVRSFVSRVSMSICINGCHFKLKVFECARWAPALLHVSHYTFRPIQKLSRNDEAGYGVLFGLGGG